MKLTIFLHLVPRLTSVQLYLHFPHTPFSRAHPEVFPVAHVKKTHFSFLLESEKNGIFNLGFNFTTGIHWPVTAARTSHGQLSCNKSSTFIAESCRRDTTPAWLKLCSLLNNMPTLWNELRCRIRSDNSTTLSRYVCWVSHLL